MEFCGQIRNFSRWKCIVRGVGRVTPCKLENGFSVLVQISALHLPRSEAHLYDSSLVGQYLKQALRAAGLMNRILRCFEIKTLRTFCISGHARTGSLLTADVTRCHVINTRYLAHEGSRSLQIANSCYQTTRLHIHLRPVILQYGLYIQGGPFAVSPISARRTLRQRCAPSRVTGRFNIRLRELDRR